MRRILILLMLIPSLLWAGVTVKRAKQPTQPPGTIERVSKRTIYSKTYEYGQIGSNRFQSIISTEPLHYADSTGALVEYDFDLAPDTAAGYNLTVNSGRFTVDIDTLTGAMRFTRDRGSKKGSISFTPGFSAMGVGIEFDISARGVKASYRLNNGNRLAWSHEYTSALDTTGAQGKGKGRIKNALNQIRAEVREFTAFDANDQPVLLTAEWTNDSLIVSLDTTGAIFPITVDPTVYDTIINASSGGLLSINGRNTSSAYGPYLLYFTGDGAYVGYSSAQWRRAYISMLFDSTLVSAVDSAFLWLRPFYTTTTDTMYLGPGTFTGSTLSVNWWPQFIGNTGDAPYTFTNLFESGVLTPADTTSFKPFRLTAAMCDSIRDYMTRASVRDTMRLVFMNKVDYDNVSTTTKQSIYWGMPYFTIFYYAGTTPTLSVVGDTLYASAQLVSSIDTTGGLTISTRGFKYCQAAGDTTTISESGSFGEGSYSLLASPLDINATYYFWPFATNQAGTSYGSVMSFKTTGGGTIYVDGRQVNSIR